MSSVSPGSGGSPPSGSPLTAATIAKDLLAGTVVFLVALPLCLGIALASGATGEDGFGLFSGLIAGIVGGLVVASLSGSHTSVSGPAAGLTAIVIAQVGTLGFHGFLLAVFLAGVLQIIFGLARLGFVAAFFPTSVIKGLLAAIGVILILKQIPHLFGHDADPEGEMSFFQPDNETTFSELVVFLTDVHYGAAVIGLASLAVLILWQNVRLLRESLVPAPLVVVLLGVGLNVVLRSFGDGWEVGIDHLVRVPVAESISGMTAFLAQPDWNMLGNGAVYVGAFTIALVASLETLLNLEAVDDLDVLQRTSPPSRELLAQGAGNICCGLLGGLPVTSVIVRSSVNVYAGGRTKLSAIFHGVLLVGSVVFLPQLLNLIPLSCLAAILIVIGLKLASPQIVRDMYRNGWVQFLPFLTTVVAIVFTDLLVGILIGLGVAILFILRSNIRRPVRRIIETHLSGEVVHLVLANQVSFLNRGAISEALDGIAHGSHVMIDASGSDYIDHDVITLIQEYKTRVGPARNVQVSTKGFQNRHQLPDEIQYVNYSTRELQEQITPQQVRALLEEGHVRFRTGRRLPLDFREQLRQTEAQHPLAVVLSCIDSRAPAELIFDCGLGDIFSVRVAGNILSRKVLGSIEYGVAVAGSKLILVMGHTRCGAVTAAVNFAGTSTEGAAAGAVAEATGCQHIEPVLDEIEATIREGVDSSANGSANEDSPSPEYIDDVARAHVARTVHQLTEQSTTLTRLVTEGKVEIVGAMYNVQSGTVSFLDDGRWRDCPMPNTPGTESTE